MDVITIESKYNPQNEAFLNFKTKRTYFVL